MPVKISAKIKICGVTQPEDIDTLNALEVDMAGFNFYKPSPRYLHEDRAAQMAGRCRPQMERVALLVDPSDDEIDMALAAISPHRLQLHGTESPARVAEIRTRHQCAIIKALSIQSAEDIKQAAAYDGVVDWFLFDAAPPADGLPGGNGETFDWTVLNAYDQSQPYLLAGGLNAANVGEALQISGASMVDISSGVERASGVKDHQKIEQFVSAVRSYAPAQKGNR